MTTYCTRTIWKSLRWGTWVVLIIGLAGTLPLQAQTTDPAPGDDDETYTFAVRSVPLEEALQQLVEQTSVDLAYSTATVEGRVAYCRKREAPIEDILGCVLAGTGVDYLRTARGSYLLVEAPEVRPAKSTISGRVRDAETGEPLPRANVLLADAATGTTTDEAGRFNFAGVLPGEHRLVVTHVGYGTAVDSVEAPPGERASVDLSMDQKVFQTDPVVIDGLQRRLPSSGLGQEVVDADRLVRLSEQGTPDVLRSASQQIGVTLNRPLAEINVQGGDSGEHVMMLDGVPVRQPLTLGRLLGAFSPHALDRVTVHKAGFGAQQGSYTAGALAARHDLERSNTRIAEGSADPISLNSRASGGWRQTTTGTGQVMAAVRSSVWDVYQAPALSHLLDTHTMVDPTFASWWMDAPEAQEGEATQAQVSDLRFVDAHAALRQEITPFQQLYVSAYHGRTTLDTDLARFQPVGEHGHHMDAQDQYDWSNTAVQARYEWVAGGRVTGSLQLYGSWHEADTRYDYNVRDSVLASEPVGDLRPPEGRITDADATDNNRIGEWGGTAEMDVSLTPNVRLSAGVEPKYLDGRFQVLSRFLGDLSYDTNSWQVGSYAEAEITPGLNLTATLGTRLTYLPPRRTAYAEPRLSVRYDTHSTAIGSVAARLAGGLYRQYITQSEISKAGPTSIAPSVQFWAPLDESLAPPRAYHAAGDLLVAPTERWSLRLETYYKAQPRTLEFDYAGLVADHSGTETETLPRRVFDAQEAFIAPGQGRAYGIATQIQREGTRVTGRLGAELNRTERRYPGRFDGQYVPAPWEQPVRLTADLDVRLTENVTLQSDWQGIWGRSWALRRAYYDYLGPMGAGPAPGTVDLSNPGAQTLDPFHRLDLGVRLQTTVQGIGLDAEVNLVNVTDRQNAFDRSLNLEAAPPASMERTLPGRRLFVMLTLRY